MTECLLDTAVFIYAVGTEHTYREPCRSIVRLAGERRLRGLASANVVQEFAHQRMRRTGDRGDAVRQARRLFAICRILDVESADMRRALELADRHQELDFQDAVYAATALNRSIRVVVSPDRAFDTVEGLERIDPLDTAAITKLAM